MIVYYSYVFIFFYSLFLLSFVGLLSFYYSLYYLLSPKKMLLYDWKYLNPLLFWIIWKNPQGEDMTKLYKCHKIFTLSYPKPWLLSLALLGSHEENQPVYWSWLEQVIWSGFTDPASKPRGLWYGHSARGSETKLRHISLWNKSQFKPVLLFELI